MRHGPDCNYCLVENQLQHLEACLENIIMSVDSREALNFDIFLLRDFMHHAPDDLEKHIDHDRYYEKSHEKNMRDPKKREKLERFKKELEEFKV